MQQIYLKRMTKQDITRSVTICTESVDRFWGVSREETSEYMPIKICSENNPTYFPQDITIHKGYQGEKDWRITGSEFKKLYVDDEPQELDIMCVKKTNIGNFVLSIIKQDSAAYTILKSFFKGNDNYAIIDIDDEQAETESAHNDIQSLQQIYFGAPGTGKSHEIKKNIGTHKSFRITFHPDTDYSSFVGAYKPTSVEVPMLTPLGDKAIPMKDAEGNALTENKIIYTYVKQAFLNAYIEAWKEQANETPQPVYLVIEEINRGNCAQIFGDIFQLLDRNTNGFSDYAIVPDADLSRHVKKDLEKLVIANKEGVNAIYEECEEDMVEKVVNGKVLLLPNNLYIWATMNTSDQSLFPIDSAFKRRWDWKYIKIADAHKNWQIKVGAKTYDWWLFVQAINYFVFDATQSEDKNLGYFFAKAKDSIINAETFVSKVIFYLYTDVFKDYGFSGDIFKGANDDEMTFQSFYNADGSPCEAQIIRFIENVMFYDALPDDLKATTVIEDNTSNSKKKLIIEFPDGTVIKENTQFETYFKALEKIGFDKAETIASAKRYSRLDCPLISKTQYEAILNNTQGFSYVNAGEYFIIKGIIVTTMKDFITQVSDELSLGINCTIEK